MLSGSLLNRLPKSLLPESKQEYKPRKEILHIVNHSCVQTLCHVWVHWLWSPPAVYLSCHLPDTVDELQEDRRAIRICVILVPMANSLKQKDKELESHRASWGICWGQLSATHLNLYQQLKKLQMGPDILLSKSVGKGVKDSNSLCL